MAYGLRHGREHCEDAPEYEDGAYTVAGWGAAVAWRVWGWETQPDEDTEWTGIEERTGPLLACMVGDDRLFPVDPDDLTPLDDLDYCAECGQVGCCHDGRPRPPVDIAWINDGDGPVKLANSVRCF